MAVQKVLNSLSKKQSKVQTIMKLFYPVVVIVLLTLRMTNLLKICNKTNKYIIPRSSNSCGQNVKKILKIYMILDFIIL